MRRGWRGHGIFLSRAGGRCQGRHRAPLGEWLERGRRRRWRGALTDAHRSWRQLPAGAARRFSDHPGASVMSTAIMTTRPLRMSSSVGARSLAAIGDQRPDA
jgi:hypothetical protein